MQQLRSTMVGLTMALLVLTGCQAVGNQVAAPRETTAPEPADGGTPADSTQVPAVATEDEAEDATEEAAMDHGAMQHSQTGDVPFDATFIDGMVVHHEGAVAMAQQVLAESERPELRQMAETIIAAQEGEIEQMQAWREQWYPDQPATGGMEMEMGTMAIPSDDATPFDQRFLEAMIDHHQGALAMAATALEEAEHQEVRSLAQAIITAQESEIDQMRAWLNEWFGVQ